MIKRFSLIIGLVIASLLAVAAIAFATPGNSINTGTVSVDVENIYLFDASFTGITTKTMDVDCPSGKQVVVGNGIAVNTQSQSIESVQAGSALDADTWRVTWTGLNTSSRYVYTVNAICR